MASRYTIEQLLQLQPSPLCVKPPNLPPAEQWMGPPPDNARTSQARVGTDRQKNTDGSFVLDQASRRPGGEKHHPRNPSNSEPIVLGPPKIGYASSSIRSTVAKASGGEADSKTFRDQDPRDRFGQRARNDQSAGMGVFSGSSTYGSSNTRDSRNNPNFRRRGDAEQDSDGWSTVKPRKSFGPEGAERFQGRIGSGGNPINSGNGTGDRFGREDRRARDRDESDLSGRDRPRRIFDRDTGDESNDGPRRNGPSTRGNWFKDGNNDAGDDKTDRGHHNDRADRNGQRDRIDRNKNWRERDPDTQHTDNFREKNNDRGGGGGGGGGFERRWGRDNDNYQMQRPEREPEWMDEGDVFADEKPSGGHTEEDFRRFMEDMKASRSDGPKQAEQSTSEQALKKSWRPESAPGPAVELGPDRFFEQFSKTSRVEEGITADRGEAVVKTKVGKASKFTSFFSSQEDTKRQTEPPTPAASLPPQSPPNGGIPMHQAPPDSVEKEAFQALLQKLKIQKQQGDGSPAGSATSPAAPGGMGIGAPPGLSNGTPPGRTAFQDVPAPQDGQPKGEMASPDAVFLQNQPYPPGLDRRDDPRFRGNMPLVPPQQLMQDLNLRGPPHIASSGQSPSGLVRPEQMLQELLLQGQQATSQEGSGPRIGTSSAQGAPGPNMTASNPQTEFLMRLMQSRNTSDDRRPDELLMRMPQPQKQVSIPSVSDHEADMAEFARERDRMNIHRQQQMRPSQGPPGLFVDEQFRRQDVENRPPPQPTQILQRPPLQSLQGPEHAMHGLPPPFLQGGGGVGGRMAPQQGMHQQGLPQQVPQQPMIPPPPGLGVNHPSNRAMANMPNAHNLPPNMPSNMPPNLPPSMPPNMMNMPNIPNMPMPNMPAMFPPNFSPSGPFPPDGIPSGLPRNMPPPPPGFFNGPGAPPGFMPPPGMGFQGPLPDGVPFPFSDGRGMPPTPHGAGFRRS